MREPLRRVVGDLIAQAEHSLATLERYRAGLEILAQGHILDAPAFARALLAGQGAPAAWGADVAAMDAPRGAEEQAAFAASLRRIELRREIVRAAIDLEARERDAVADACYATAYRPWQAAEQQLYTLARAFRAAGGDEVTG